LADAAVGVVADFLLDLLEEDIASLLDAESGDAFYLLAPLLLQALELAADIIQLMFFAG
jgi:hypothetical protein